MRLVLALSRTKRPKEAARCVLRILQAIAEYNADIIRAGGVPPLYESGVRYRQEDGESFQDCRYVLRAGWADCSNLAAWRAGELIAAGEKARVRAHWRVYSDGIRRFHLMVRREDGWIEDPSRKLGMQ